MAMDKRGKAKVGMHLYLLTVVEAVSPASGHVSEVLFVHIGV